FDIKSSISAGQRSTRCTRPRSSASAEARRARRTSSVARSQLPLRSPRPRAGSSCFTPRHCTATPYDGHTLGPVIADLEKLTGVTVRRIHGDKGYRGHNYPNRFKVWISGQVRRVTKAIRREMRRRAAIEPVIGHERRRLDRERYLAANPEIEAEIVAPYQGKAVPRGQPASLAGLPKPCAATLATGEIKMAHQGHRHGVLRGVVGGYASAETPGGRARGARLIQTADSAVRRRRAGRLQVGSDTCPIVTFAF